jgi:tRNA pseudouridine32 synthase / 23S rRNA pseudouridine746 synthase
VLGERGEGGVPVGAAPPRGIFDEDRDLPQDRVRSAAPAGEELSAGDRAETAAAHGTAEEIEDHAVESTGMDVRVLHESPGVLAVAKPEGISTIPERDLAVPSLQRLLEERRGERLWVVHRLDKEVSGLVLFARNPEAHRELSLAFEHRRVHKTYLALVHGVVEKDRFTVELPLKEFGSGRMGVHDRGKPSVTEIVVRQRLADLTLVEASPVTGRRHQLRVHLYASGHPIVGDVRYGDRARAERYPRLMLHSLRLSTEAAGIGQLECPPPESFRALLDRLASSGPS